MPPPAENEPDAEKIVGNNAAARAQDVAQRVMKAQNFLFPGQNPWQGGAEKLKSHHLGHGAQSARQDEKENLPVFFPNCPHHFRQK